MNRPYSHIGLNKIAASVGDHEPVVELDEPLDLGDYTRQRGVILSFRIVLWLCVTLHLIVLGGLVYLWM